MRWPSERHVGYGRPDAVRWRNRAQNGWFVLRSLILRQDHGAVVWHIRPDVIPNWTRPPMIAHSQVGYAPDFSRAVLELDPKYKGPKTPESCA